MCGSRVGTAINFKILIALPKPVRSYSHLESRNGGLRKVLYKSAQPIRAVVAPKSPTANYMKATDGPNRNARDVS